MRNVPPHWMLTERRTTGSEASDRLHGAIGVIGDISDIGVTDTTRSLTRQAASLF